MKRIKMSQGYNQAGYGRGFKKSPYIYLINGKLYAKDKAGWESTYSPLQGELEGYVRINLLKNTLDPYYYQVSLESDHQDYVTGETTDGL